MQLQHKRLVGGGLTLFPPAKINLFLEVLSRRQDGFHEISSLIQKIYLTDTLTIIPSDSFQFICDRPPFGEDNLVVRAFRAFEKKLGRSLSFRVTLEKKIPMQAGLGGGSSDAASLLLGLNFLLNNPLDSQELHAMGLSLGSDIPLFLHKDAALLIGGRGEIVAAIASPLPPNQKLTLFIPPYGLPTKAVYEALPLKHRVGTPSFQDRLEAVRNGNWQLHNDLEEPAFHLEPRLRELKERLISTAIPSLMSGSGSALFSLGADVSLSGVQSLTVTPL